MAIRRLGTSSITNGAKSSKLWDQTTAQNDFFSIATAVVDSNGASNITFSNIPQTFTHLQLRVLFKPSANPSWANISFNSDTTYTNYANHDLRGNGSSANSYFGQGSGTYIYTILYVASPTSNIFAGGVVDVLNYASSNKNKTVRSLGGVDANGSGNADLASGLWTSTSPITSITINTNNGDSFTQYSKFALYGVK